MPILAVFRGGVKDGQVEILPYDNPPWEYHFDVTPRIGELSGYLTVQNIEGDYCVWVHGHKRAIYKWRGEIRGAVPFDKKLLINPHVYDYDSVVWY